MFASPVADVCLHSFWASYSPGGVVALYLRLYVPWLSVALVGGRTDVFRVYCIK